MKLKPILEATLAVKWLDTAIQNIYKKWETLKHSTIHERDETIRAAKILKDILSGKEVPAGDRIFMRNQAKDLMKILSLVSLSLVPLPIPLTVIAVMLGKKIGVNLLPSSHLVDERDSITNEDLRKWFGKGKWGGKGGGGWDRYNSDGERVGKCGEAEEGDAYAACLSKAAAEKLGKKGRASFVRRKRAAQNDADRGDKGDGSKGKKPIRVSWDKKGTEKKYNPPQ